MYKDTLIQSIHRVQRNDPFIHDLFAAIGQHMDRYSAAMMDSKQQLDIQTATWALAIYERELGLESNASKPLNDRRSAIIARMRGSVRIGAEGIKLITDSWLNGDVEITFDGTIHITFKSMYGIPEDLESLKAEIRMIAPAHLGVEYHFMYTFYSEVTAKGIPYSGLTHLTYEQLVTGGLG